MKGSVLGRRRSLALVVAALTAPNIAAVQSPDRVRRIGWLRVSGSPGVRLTLVEALRELGWVEGRNIIIEPRHAEGRREQALALAKELVVANVELIVAEAPTAIRAAMQATADVPIVMAWWGGPDLVASGVIGSYSRPGGNVTGVDMLLSALDAKRLDVLRQAVPNATKIAVLIHDRQTFEPQMPAVREVARKSGLSLEVFDTRNNSVSYNETLEAIARAQCQAVLVMSSPLFARDNELIIDAAARARVPAIAAPTLNAAEGALITYGTTPRELDRQVARQVDRILRGARPGDLPVEQPSRFELVINQSAARALGLVIPPSLLLQADKVIE